MRSAKATSSKAGRFVFTAFAAIALASAPSFVFAQHGGGHGGGGGGGAHAGGGGRSSGGFSGSSGRSSGGGSPARSSAGSYRPAPSAPSYSRPSSSYSRPSGNAYRSAAPYNQGRDAYRAPSGNRGPYAKGGYAGGGASGANASRVAPSDSQWHSFRPSTSAQASDSARSTNAGTTRSFVGQGHDLYEESPRTGGASAAARPATVGGASRTASSNVRSSSPAVSTAFASRGLLAGNASFGARTFAARGIAGAAPGIAGAARFGFGWRPVAPLFPRPGFGFGLGLRPGFGFGGLGPVFRPFGFGFGRFGLGFGFGLGWNPCWGAVWDDPFCFGGFAGPAYDSYGYPPYDPSYDPNAYPPQSFGPDPNYDPGNQAGGPAPDSQSHEPSEPANPNWDTTANAGIAIQPGSVIIYLKDGTSLSPSDYWITDDQLHYTLAGSENTVGLDHVDLRRTNDENAKRGVRFWLKSEPEKTDPGNNGVPSGDAPAASPTPGPGDNATPGPASEPPASAPYDAPSAEPL